MHAQEFSSEWPVALDDMLEFIALTHLALGRGRSGRVKVSVSRARVAASELQPHVGRFRERLAQQVPGLRLEFAAGTQAAHRVEVHYGS